MSKPEFQIEVKKYIVWMSILVISVSCNPHSEHLYYELEKKELASGVRYDSLFKGLYLGMPHEDFRDYCLEMHKAREFREGGLKSGSWVEWKLPDELSYPAFINFYPEFKNDVISEMRAGIYYDNTLVFTKENPFHQDSLLHDVLHLMDQWYGPGFIKVESPDKKGKDVYVKINGNRRITVFKGSSNYIIDLWFVDLLARKEDDDQ